MLLQFMKKKDCTILGRDIFGIKPLYFSLLKMELYLAQR